MLAGGCQRVGVETGRCIRARIPLRARFSCNPCDVLPSLRSDDLLAVIAEHSSELALVMLPGVQYYTGQVLPMTEITAAAHDVGARVGFDLAHAVGNVPLALHDWNVDFAAWCSYKYLNGGPGGVGGAFVHVAGLEPADPFDGGAAGVTTRSPTSTAS